MICNLYTVFIYTYRYCTAAATNIGEIYPLCTLNSDFLGFLTPKKEAGTFAACQPVRLQLPLQVTSFYSQKLESGPYSSQAEKESSSENQVCVKEASKKRNPKNPSWTKLV